MFIPTVPHPLRSHLCDHSECSQADFGQAEELGLVLPEGGGGNGEREGMKSSGSWRGGGRGGADTTKRAILFWPVPWPAPESCGRERPQRLVLVPLPAEGAQE